MNILRQKLDIKPSLPENLTQQTQMWDPLHLELSAALSDILPSQYMPDGMKTKFDELGELMKILPDAGVFLGFGSNESPCMCFASFGPEEVHAVTANLLGLSAEANPETYKPSRLDLLLFKPVMKTLEAEFEASMTAIDAHHGNHLLCSEQEVALKKLNISFSTENWCAITFFLKGQEDISEDETGEEKPEKTAGAKSRKSKKSELQDRRSFKLVLTVNMLQRFTTAFDASQDKPVVDPLDPWTNHMRSSLDRAIIPIRAVVETCRMTVAECTRLEIGQVIKMPGVSLQSIGLETESGRGKDPFAVGALGIYKSHRAVKLVEDMDPAFLPDVGLI